MIDNTADDASIRAVGRKEGNYRLHSRQKEHHEQHPDTVAEPLVFLAEMEGLAVLAGTLGQHADMGNTVLQHTQRAYCGAIDAAEA